MAINYRALIVVDVQCDFCEGGSLAVAGGNLCAEHINAYIKHMSSYFTLVIATRDMHENPGPHWSDAPDYVDTWPPHCGIDTPGCELHPDIDRNFIDLEIHKGRNEAAYSGFDGTAFNAHSDTDMGLSLYQLLQSEGITEVVVCGIATDYCVKATVLDSLRFGFDTYLVENLTVAVADKQAAIKEMEAAGCQTITAVSYFKD